MTAAAPLLRSPPFPRVPRDVATVSAPVEHPSGVRAERDREHIFTLIREARVGGTFWAVPPPVRDATAILAARSWADALAMYDTLTAAQKRRPLVLLPCGARPTGKNARLLRQSVPCATGEVDPWPLLEAGATIFAHGDNELAALAGIAGCELKLASQGTFGLPDESSERHAARILQKLLDECTYRNPFEGGETSLEATVERLSLWRGIIEANHGIASAAGIAWWKQAEIKTFLWAPRPLRFPRSEERAIGIARKRSGAVAIWPSRVSPEMAEKAEAMDVPLVRIEDGFIRSVGLGSNLFPPFSIALDRRGIHYDPSRPSDLEHLLATSTFPPQLLERAENLRTFIIRAGVSKYGASRHHNFPARQPDRRLILVPGQVEDDMSVLNGGGGLTSNHELLRRARAMEPDAEIWFRPHPDVDAGHRKGAVRDEDALALADHVVRGGGMAQLLDIVDGVHVLTSLTGFEALLRSRPVTCHGTPFYSGWGLTRDILPAPKRRERALSLLELIAGVLILYPRYLDPVTGLPCPAEILIRRIAEQQHPRSTWLTRLRSLQGRIMGVKP